MSASSKKKLRKEQVAAKLTEKQQTERKEAKKLRVYTTVFVVVLAALLVVAIFVGIRQTISSSGILEKNTTALTVGEHKISNAELSYFYIDYINNFYSNNGSVLPWMGLDVTLPLNQQVTNEETGATWADDFLDAAKENARSVYALTDAAKAEGFELSAEEKLNIEYSIYNLDTYALAYGFEDADAYLKALYGNGASAKSFLAYNELTALADAYYAHRAQSLTYEDADYRAAEQDNYDTYSSYSYSSYYLSNTSFLEGGTTDENGITTYSDEEKAAASAAAEKAAKDITTGEIATVEEFDAAISGVIDGASSTLYSDTLYSNVNTAFVDWVTDSARKAGDMTYVPNLSTTAAEGETASSYYLVYFHGSNDNTMPLANVRHILIPFEGGITDETTGATTYTDEAKAAAMATAEEILNQWKSGEATEESFAALANEKSTDAGSNTNGGLYENVYPGQMVANFNDWCFDSSRKAGDTGIVQTEYGCHIMFYSAKSDLTYRDFMIDNMLRNSNMDTWFTGLVESTPVTVGDTKYIRMDTVLGG